MLIDKNSKDDSRTDIQDDTDCGGIKNQNNAKTIDKLLMRLSAFSLQGKRSHMEDFFAISYQMKPEEQQKSDEWPYEYFYFGIFDGHGGRDAAEFSKENLLKFIVKQSDFWSDNDDDILRSIQKGYADTHEAMRKIMHTWPRTQKCLPSTAGTTASVLFIKNGKYYTGHVGDSRIVISREDPDSHQWIPHQLTDDHKPESDSEIARIRRAGGDVKQKVGVHRVVWRRPVLESEYKYQYLCRDEQDLSEDDKSKASKIASYPICESLVEQYQVIPFLAIARSLGDFWSINPYSGLYIVSPEPDVSCRPIHPDDKCILLATDGLWSVVSSQLAIRALEEFKVVHNGERSNEHYLNQYFSTDNFYHVMRTQDRDNYALSLVYFAYQVWERRSLRSDNITAVVAMLGDILGPQEKHPANRTRSSSHSQLQCSAKLNRKGPPALAEPCSIGPTRMYHEIVKLDKAPSFKTVSLDKDDLICLEHLGNWLMLPPSALPKVRDTSIVSPIDFTRLLKAEVRSIDHPVVKVIYIKDMLDNFKDEELQPERRSEKSGALVRDAFAQCTQSVYDFSEPWVHEYNYDVEIFSDHDDYKVNIEDCYDDDVDRYDDDDDFADNGAEPDDEDNDGVVVLEESNNRDHLIEEETEVEEEEDEEGFEEEFDDLEDEINQSMVFFESVELDVWSKEDDKGKKYPERPNTRRSSKENKTSSSREHMLQPRSDNCEDTPNSRRNPRSRTYLSQTTDPKRKVVHESPKSNKRRKSHPMHRAAAL